MTADATYLVLTLIGVAVLLTGSLARNAISVIGGLILLYYAYATLKSYRKSVEAPDSMGTGNHYLMGLVMGLTNPLGILWWVTAGAAFVAMFNVFGVIGFMVGLFAWVSYFSVFVHYAGKKGQNRIPGHHHRQRPDDALLRRHAVVRRREDSAGLLTLIFPG